MVEKESWTNKRCLGPSNSSQFRLFNISRSICERHMTVLVLVYTWVKNNLELILLVENTSVCSSCRRRREFVRHVTKIQIRSSYSTNKFFFHFQLPLYEFHKKYVFCINTCVIQKMAQNTCKCMIASRCFHTSPSLFYLCQSEFCASTFPWTDT